MGGQLSDREPPRGMAPVRMPRAPQTWAISQKPSCIKRFGFRRLIGDKMTHSFFGKTTTKLVASIALSAGMLVSGAAWADDFTLRVGSVLPEGHPIIEGFHKFNELANERSGGSLTVEVFPNGQLGNTQDMMDQSLAGANVAAFTDASRLATFTPKLGVIGAPFVFGSYEEADEFVGSDTFKAWGEDLRNDSGYVVLSFNWYQGPRYLMTNKKINSRADVEGLRIRTPGAPAWVAAGRALGGTPTPLAWAEIYSGLQLGSVDAAEAGPAAAQSMKFNEVASHYTKTGHIELITGLVVGEAWWDKLDAEQQEILQTSAVEAGKYMSELNIAADGEAMDYLAANGMTISEIDTAEFVAAAQSEIDELGLREAYDEVRAELDGK